MMLGDITWAPKALPSPLFFRSSQAFLPSDASGQSHAVRTPSPVKQRSIQLSSRVLLPPGGLTVFPDWPANFSNSLTLVAEGQVLQDLCLKDHTVW